MKVRDDGKRDAKAANRLLREVDWEETVDKAGGDQVQSWDTCHPCLHHPCHQDRRQISQVLTDLNFLGRELEREGRLADKTTLFQVFVFIHFPTNLSRKPPRYTWCPTCCSVQWTTCLASRLCRCGSWPTSGHRTGGPASPR